MRPGRLVLVFALTVAGSACEHDPRAVFIARPLIADGASAVLRRDSLVTSSEVVGWRFRDGDPDRLWNLSTSEKECEWTSEGLRVHAQRRHLTLSREVDFDASEIDACRLVIEGFDGNPVSIGWARDGEGFSNDRELSVDEPSSKKGRHETYTVSLRGHPEWRGRIARVRFSCLLPSSRRGTLIRASFDRQTVDETVLASATAEPWKINVSNDVRPGWLASEGHPLRVEGVAVPEESKQPATE
jgi:hypothetical protein